MVKTKYYKIYKMIYILGTKFNVHIFHWFSRHIENERKIKQYKEI